LFFHAFFLRIATAKDVTITIAAITDTSAALLNSGTVGVGEDEVGLDELAVVGLGVVDAPDGSDITARLPMLPAVEPGLLTAYTVLVPES
jgi:hypothetical protein